jgi:hypothetical protein
VHPSAAQHLLDPVEHLGGAVLGELHLDLCPGRGAGLGAEGVAGDPVVGDGGDGVAVGVGQRPLPANGGELGDGLERRAGWAARLKATSGSGGLRDRPGGRRTSSRLSVPAGSLRCQPSSLPPRRRRRVSPERASRWSAVS